MSRDNWSIPGINNNTSAMLDELDRLKGDLVEEADVAHDLIKQLGTVRGRQDTLREEYKALRGRLRDVILNQFMLDFPERP